MKTITVEVTQEDIENGECGQCQTCPIALALGRATGRPWMVTDTFAFESNGTSYARLPGVAQGFVLRFDENHPVAPFTFTIEAPK